jgi:hypothetical protein
MVTVAGELLLVPSLTTSVTMNRPSLSGVNDGLVVEALDSKAVLPVGFRVSVHA